MSQERLLELVGERVDDPELQGLGMLISLKGASDAGHLHAQLSNGLLTALDAELFARFDADELVCYSAQRPRVTFVADHFAGYQAPGIDIYLLTDELGRKFWFLTGVEPDLRWERFVSELCRFVDAYNVPLTASAVSLPMPVPHTRPIGVTAHGNRQDLIENISTWSPTAETPASVTALLEIRLNDQQRDVVGYSLHTPHYLSESEYPAVAVAGLEYLGAALKLALPTEKLREAARLVEGQLAEQLASSEDVKQMVDGFEARFDAHAHQHEQRSLLVDVDQDLPDAEQLGARAEDFLASLGDTGPWLDAAHQREAGESPES
ncbi:proteasome assembly chaperone family protein [Glutamicibacter endophyticus]|uniref:proteasome assembly chaperone family protein n=1 Tax=Glutamicibacter endophyticus TaxID=1522174 RepID=UPI003AF05853